MDIIAFTLSKFRDEVPTHSDLIQTVWRPYFHKLEKSDRPVFLAIMEYAQAYHYLKSGNLRSLEIKGSYKKLVDNSGVVNPALPTQLDINELQEMYRILKNKEQAEQNDLISQRQALIDEEMRHIQKTLNDLNSRLSEKGLSYSIKDINWVAHINLWDTKTEKKHIKELKP